MEVTDFRKSAIVRDANSELAAAAAAAAAGAAQLYQCVRLSWNGEHIHQLCDPNDPVSGRTTGVVRAAVEEFFNDLKRAHFIDRQTRAVTITLPLRSNHLAVRARVTLMVEFTATGTVLPSYDMENRVESGVKVGATQRYADIAMVLVAVFVMLELLESLGTAGIVSVPSETPPCCGVLVASLRLAYTMSDRKRTVRFVNAFLLSSRSSTADRPSNGPTAISVGVSLLELSTAGQTNSN